MFHVERYSPRTVFSYLVNRYQKLRSLLINSLKIDIICAFGSIVPSVKNDIKAMFHVEHNVVLKSMFHVEHLAKAGL